MCLNRTFYGIETVPVGVIKELLIVLIVPFMELKLLIHASARNLDKVLIVPFMELKPSILLEDVARCTS